MVTAAYASIRGRIVTHMAVYSIVNRLKGIICKKQSFSNDDVLGVYIILFGVCLPLMMFKDVG